MTGKEPADTASTAAAQASTAASSSSQQAPVEVAGLPPRTLRRLMSELKQLQNKREQNIAEYGIDVRLADPEGNDLRIWQLHMHADKLNQKSGLAKALQKFAIDVVVFELWIPDAFPTAPPRVRVLKPTFNTGSFFVFSNGALCMETLSQQGWSPALSLLQLGLQMKATMSEGSGSIYSPAATAGASDNDRKRAWETFEKIEESHKDWDPFRT